MYLLHVFLVLARWWCLLELELNSTSSIFYPHEISQHPWRGLPAQNEPKRYSDYRKFCSQWKFRVQVSFDRSYSQRVGRVNLENFPFVFTKRTVLHFPRVSLGSPELYDHFKLNATLTHILPLSVINLLVLTFIV